MKFNSKGIKSLEFESAIDSTWYSMKTNYDKTLITELLERCDIGFDREDIMDWGNYGVADIIDKYGLEETIKGFKSYVPSNMENVWGDETEVTCLCEDCDYYKKKDDRGWLGCYSFFGSCWEDLVIYVTMAVMIGGNSAKKEIEEQWGLSRIWIDRICDNQCGWFEEELYEKNMSIEEAVLKFKKIVYGDDNMFFRDLSKLKLTDEISVYWIEDLMYVNDEHDNQAVAQTTLYEAYKFALLIQATIFDYTANDEEVKNLGEQVLTLVDRDECPRSKIINIWNYFDDVSEDFEKLTGIKLDIDDKRAIVANITEVGDENHAIGSLECCGSATFIANLLWKYIKPCNNLIINKLADDYLQVDEYDLIKFAEELHKKANEENHLKNDAIEEIVSILLMVKQIQKVLGQFGVNYHSDSWSATDFCDDYENILTWVWKDFEKINCDVGDSFYIGGSVCSAEFMYDNVLRCEPRDLAEMKGEVLIRYLVDLLDKLNPQFFDLKIYDDGLEENCGWEHSIGIKATVKSNALKY